MFLVVINIYGEFLKSFFQRENIKYYSCLPLEECRILYRRKLPEFTQSACFFLVPYFAKDDGKRNVSLYAVPRDYHLYISLLEKRLEAEIAEFHQATKVQPQLFARVFSDNSPFDERFCAGRAGLGKVGKSRLLVNPEYGSYVFIAAICLSHNISITQIPEKFNSDICGNCEKCITACPMHSGMCRECLSEITQKKTITAQQEQIISKAALKWGCDICQQVCPYNKAAARTPIEYFKTDRVPYLTPQSLAQMSEAEFSQRAYAWRTRKVIERNLEL